MVRGLEVAAFWIVGSAGEQGCNQRVAIAGDLSPEAVASVL